MLAHSVNFVQAVQNVVLDPSLNSAWPLFLLSFFNDLIGVFPFALVLAGQLLFLEGTFNVALAAKLLVFVALPVGLGSALASIPAYALTYLGGKPVIEKYHKFFHFSWKDVEKVNSYFKGSWYDEAIFLALRCAPILPSLPLNIAAGILRMRFWPFFFLTAVGAVVRMMITLILVGMGVLGLSQI